MHDFQITHVPCSLTANSCSHVGPHAETNFNLKVINFAAANKSWRLVCNSGNAKSCEAHCSRQFPGDALSIDECSKAVKEAFGSGMGACFPMKSVVTRKADGIVALSEIRVGDEVLVSADTGIKYDKVIGFLHWDDQVDIEYVRINHGAGFLMIHRDHLLPVKSAKGDWKHVKASAVKKGDKLQSLWIDGVLVESEVGSISLEKASGMCCPMTMSGTIIVDSVLCSCYSCPTSLLPFEVSHNMCHAVMAPVRLYESLTGKSNAAKQSPGIHPYARALMTAVTGVVFA